MTYQTADELMLLKAEALAKSARDPKYLGEAHLPGDIPAVWRWAERMERTDILSALATVAPVKPDTMWKARLEAWADGARAQGNLLGHAGFLEALVPYEFNSIRRLCAALPWAPPR